MGALDKDWMTFDDKDSESGGNDVLVWQRMIGINNPNGVFDDETLDKTRAWQAAHGMEPHGVVTKDIMAEAKRIASVPMSTQGMAPLRADSKPVKNPVPNQVTSWASHVLSSPSEYPMGSLTEVQDFDGRKVYARIEWHTWTHRGGKLVTIKDLGVAGLRGVTLYELLA